MAFDPNNPLGFEQKAKTQAATPGVINLAPDVQGTYTPTPAAGVNIPALNIPTPSPATATDPIDFGGATQQQFIANTLPELMKWLGSDIPQTQLNITKQFGEDLRPEQISLLETLKNLEGFDLQGIGEYVPTQAITLPDIEQDPAFQAFRGDLQSETDTATESMINEMARRGITVSGATEEGYGDISEAQSRAIAGEVGRLQSPLVRESLLQQAIEEPKRRQAFNQRISDRLLGIGLSERDIQQAGQEGSQAFDLENFLREEQQARDIRNLPMEQEANLLSQMGQRLNLPLSVMTGIPYTEQGGVARSQIEAANRRAAEQGETARDLQRSGLTGQLIGAGGSLLGRIAGDYLSSDSTAVGDFFGDLFSSGGGSVADTDLSIY
jgi:hypothetical protein